LVWLIGLVACSSLLANLPAANSSASEPPTASLQLIEFYSPM
jgi:hypothetical protein